ncbi:MAG: hypothetical protein JOY54_16120 [Acidobacteriaceae bacterium]|nr:hypothetical protein [Acidobacteriaceae bacterium]
MSKICTVCGYDKSRVIADARALGLEEDFSNGLYSCCQIARWADEQWEAWLEAMQQDLEAASARDSIVEAVDLDAALVYVRKHRQKFSDKNGRRDV